MFNFKGMMGSKNNFFKAWLVLGTSQVLLLSAGASQATAAQNTQDDHLLSSQPEASATAPVATKIRVNRSFFEQPYRVTVTVKDAAGEGKTYESQADWVDYAPTAPAPAPDASTGPVLADFRDHKGCAVLADPSQVALCFKVQPDVSNLGLSAKDTSLEGLNQVVPSECTSEPSAIAFSKASRSDNGFSVEFQGSGDNCHATVSLTFERT